MTTHDSTPERASASDPKVMILGIGGEGAHIIRTIASKYDCSWLDTAVIDTDAESLKNHPARHVLHASADWGIRKGSGCGGNIITGERSLSRERAKIAQLIQDVSLLIVVGGLGGGTATGGIRTLASVARASSTATVFLFTTPFSFETFSRRKNAEDCIGELLPMVDILIPMPNDLLFSAIAPDTPVEEAFRVAANEMAEAAFGVASLLRCRDITGTDFASFMSVFRNKRTACGVGVGVAKTADGLERCALALERMLATPFLGGVAKLELAHKVIVVLSGGPDLAIGEVKRTLEHTASLLPRQTELILGANLSNDLRGMVQLTAISVRYEHVPAPVHAHSARSQFLWKPQDGPNVSENDSPARPISLALQQGELGLTSFSRGAFERFPPNKYKDEDLDVPTFQRKSISIDKGS